MEYLLYVKVPAPSKSRVELSKKEREGIKSLGLNPPKPPVLYKFVLQKRVRVSSKCRIAGSVEWAKSICPNVVKVIPSFCFLLLPFFVMGQTNITAEKESIVYTVERYNPVNTVEYSFRVVKTLKDIFKTVPMETDYILTFNGERYEIEFYTFSNEYEVFHNNQKILEVISFSHLKAELISLFYKEITGKELYLNE